MIKPYLRVVPPALDTRGGEVIALGESLDIVLDDEQKLCLNDILSTDEHGKLVAYRAVVSMPRQCGKTVVAELYSLYFALAGESVLYTSHRSDASRQFFKRVLVNLGDEHGAEIRRTNGQEEVEFAGAGGSGRRLFPDLQEGTMRDAMSRACRSANIPSYSPHDLRHRRGSLWHASGMPARELAERMGHSKASMSLDVYTHVMASDEIASERFVSLLADDGSH